MDEIEIKKCWITYCKSIADPCKNHLEENLLKSIYRSLCITCKIINSILINSKTLQMILVKHLTSLLQILDHDLYLI